MGLVSKPNTFSSGEVIIASEHNDNFDTLYNLVNGNLSTANLSTSAGIVDTQLAQITTASKVAISALVTTGDYTGTGDWSFDNIDVDGTAEVDAITLGGVAVDTAGGLGTYSTLILAGIKDYGTSGTTGTAKDQNDMYIYCGTRAVSHDSSATVTNLPFTSSSSYFVTCTRDADANNTDRQPAKVVRNSASQLTIYNTDGGDGNFNWIAIGT